jgi:lipopolysaccharide/colanic/teichoic acid biosynthesis glycosyltransferase
VPHEHGDVQLAEEPAWKRGLDIIVSAVLLVVSLPLWALVAALIKLDSPGPVLYVQMAMGRGGREFRFYKFRTMRSSSDDGPHRRYLRAFVRGVGPADRAPETGGAVYKMTDDARVTRVGRFLRKTSLDELPQLINVLKGDMSIVGPRPPLPYEYELYDDWARQRLAVRPGITGLYQVTLRSRSSFQEMVAIDLDYIRRRSPRLDLMIMAKTLPVMLLGRGAY